MSRDNNIVPDILVRAATIVLNEGWTQGAMWRDAAGKPVAAYEPPPCPVVGACGEGAIYLAAVEFGDARYRLVAYGVVTFMCGGAFWEWNDAPGRTAEEVADLLLRAAEAAS